VKILYAAGNRVGSDLQLSRFLHRTSHEVKVAAYIRSSQSLKHIDWTLDALDHIYSNKSTKLKELFGHDRVPPAGIREVESWVRDIDEFGPELVISDMEPVSAHISKALGIRLWYCSPIHLLDGIEWERGQRRYRSLLENMRKYLERMPKAERKLIYSPFGDVEMRPILREGYEWVRPYHYYILDRKGGNNKVAVINDRDRISILSKILNCIAPFDLKLYSSFSYNLSHVECFDFYNLREYKEMLSKCCWLFTTGETSIISDAIYNNINKLCISPRLDDVESLLNAILCRWYGIGEDVGQVERMGEYSVGVIERTIGGVRGGWHLSIQRRKTLDEMIGEIE